MMLTPRSVEATFYRNVNRVVEPAVRAGIGSCLVPSGMIVLETTGRTSGHTYRTPVLATLVGGRILATTSRGQTSQWLKNLAATPALRYWQGGRVRDADAFVIGPNAEAGQLAALPPFLRPAIAWLNMFGFGLAVLTPRPDAGVSPN